MVNPSPQESLAQLRDIHLPPPIHPFWPLAPGWYLLLLAMVVLSLLGWYGLRQRLHVQKGKKEALRLLTLYEKQHQAEPDRQKTAALVSELLKRVALVYFPRKQVAGLQGDAWIHFLNTTGGKAQDVKEIRHALLEWPYQTTEPAELQPLFHYARHWISQRKKPCSN